VRASRAAKIRCIGRRLGGINEKGRPATLRGSAGKVNADF